MEWLEGPISFSLMWEPERCEMYLYQNEDVAAFGVFLYELALRKKAHFSLVYGLSKVSGFFLFFFKYNP